MTSGHLLVDTSVAVALSLRGHEAHERSVESLGGQTIGLAGHAAFEAFSVLTRLPSPSRRPPAVVARILATNFPQSRFLSPQGAAQLMRRLPELSIAGGSIYDALVAATAQEHDLALVTRDRRALDTYRLFDIELKILP